MGDGVAGGPPKEKPFVEGLEVGADGAGAVVVPKPNSGLEGAGALTSAGFADSVGGEGDGESD